MTMRTTAKPKAKTKAKRATKPKTAPAVIMKSAEGIDAETVSGTPSRGRPTDYLPQYAVVGRKMCSMGATDADLAEAFGVTTVTIWRWQSEHEDFCNALIVRKGEFDDRIERSLAQRAVGYSFSSEKVFNYQGEIVRAKTIEHVPPDPGAAKLWLTNRRRSEWSDTSKHELTGANGEKLIPEQADSRDLARAIIDILREARMEAQGPDDKMIESGGEQQTSPEVAVAAADLPAAVADVPVRTFNPDAGRLG
jgi:hypothetical protein